MGAPAGGAAKPAPNGGEVLLQKVPQGFKVASQQASADAQVQELIPGDQTLDNWTEMVTTQIFFGKGGWASEKVVALIADQVAAACPDLRRGTPVQSQANNYTTTFLVLQCPNNPKTNKPEYIFLRGIQGKDSFYTIEMAYRTPPRKGDPDTPDTYLTAIKLCDTRSKDHPC